MPSSTSNTTAATEGVLCPSRICHLAVISTAFWALVFLLQSSMQGGGGASVLFRPSTFSIPLFSSGASVGPVPPSRGPLRGAAHLHVRPAAALQHRPRPRLRQAQHLGGHVPVRGQQRHGRGRRRLLRPGLVRHRPVHARRHLPRPDASPPTRPAPPQCSCRSTPAWTVACPTTRVARCGRARPLLRCWADRGGVQPDR
jgi:hypothetical protein